MALESVDLLSLLKRVRKPVAEPEEEAVEPVAVDVPEPRPVAKIEEQEEELADLRAELFGDEVLIQRILGLLYRCKKKNPNGGYLSILDMERILKIEREGASFVMSYMKNQKVIEMDDKSRMAITVPGIIYLRSVLGINAGPATVPEADSRG
jgi:hypothetical protein